MKVVLKPLIAAAILFGSLSGPALSQDSAQAATPSGVLTETFDGEDTSMLLGGQIDLRGSTTPWLVYVSDGKLVMENRDTPNSLHYNDIAWVKFPDESVLTPTEDLLISAIVESENQGDGAVGILIGSGKAGSYLMFGVDAQGRYHVMQREGRGVRLVHRDNHPAISTDAPNQVSFEVRRGNVAFYANGVELIQVPNTLRTRSGRNTASAQTGIGIAAYGIGTFRFDSVAITRDN